MKKILIKSLVFTLSVLALLLVSGCSVIGIPIGSCIGDKIGERYYEGDFVYCYVVGAGASIQAVTADYVAVLGLTDEGKQKETIIIPEEIEGKPVIQLGMTNLMGDWDSTEHGASYTRLYLPSTLICTSTHSYKLGKTFCVNPNEQLLSNGGTSWYNTSSISVSKDVYEKLKEKDIKNLLEIANVSYYVDDELYWLDDGDWYNSKSIIEPPEPTKEGYVFCGWYKESELINKWDFENDLIPPKERDEDGNIINFTNLYAKFEKIN